MPSPQELPNVAVCAFVRPVHRANPGRQPQARRGSRRIEPRRWRSHSLQEVYTRRYGDIEASAKKFVNAPALGGIAFALQKLGEAVGKFSPGTTLPSTRNCSISAKASADSTRNSIRAPREATRREIARRAAVQAGRPRPQCAAQRARANCGRWPERFSARIKGAARRQAGRKQAAIKLQRR